MNIEIANRLYEYRKANGYSQEELAEKIGVSRQAISKWERSESSPDTDNLIALAKLYNVTLDEMINGSTAPVKAEEAAAQEPVGATPQENPPLQDSVNISRHGLDVQSRDGDSVHIGFDGINVNSNNAQQFNGQTVQTVQEENKKAPWVSALVWLGGLMLFLLIGALFPRGWSVSWIILLLIPAVETGIDAILQNDANKFAYPLLATALFCALGMGFGLWHPAWVLFLTIPVYYIVVDSLKKSKKPGQGRTPVFITFAIIFSIIMCSTVGVVCNAALSGRSARVSSLANVGKMFNYENESDYLIGGASVAAADVTSLDVDWVNGSITVNPATGTADEITFTETQTTDEDLTLRYMIEEGTLKIKFCKSHVNLKSLKDFEKDLTVTVPEKMFNALEFDSVSADININKVNAAALDIDNVSGKITAKGEYNSIDVDNISGNAVISNTAANSNIDIDTVSGDFTLYLPKTVGGFVAEYDCVSGSVDTEGFDAVKNAKAKTITYGTAGNVNIDLDSVSGNLMITAE